MEVDAGVARLPLVGDELVPGFEAIGPSPLTVAGLLMEDAEAQRKAKMILACRRLDRWDGIIPFGLRAAGVRPCKPRRERRALSRKRLPKFVAARDDSAR